MIIQSVEYGTTLVFANPVQSSPNGHVEYFDITLSGLDYYGKKQVFLIDGPNGLIELFDKMASNWAGWKGEFNWGSLEDEFLITAVSDKLGHIEIKVRIQDNVGGDYWVLNGRIIVESGQLDNIAKGVRAFFLK